MEKERRKRGKTRVRGRAVPQESKSEAKKTGKDYLLTRLLPINGGRDKMT